MSEELFNTINPYLTETLGENVNPLESQINSDWDTHSLKHFESIYGPEITQQMLQQQADVREIARNSALGDARTTQEAIGDTLKNIIGTVITGPMDLVSFGAGLTGFDKFSEDVANKSNLYRENLQKMGSRSEQAMRKVYEAKQQALKNSLDREYQENIASGMSNSEADWARLGKEFTKTSINIAKSGYGSELGASAIGSIISGGVISKGISAVGKLAHAGKLVANMSPTAQKIAKATPWMTSRAGQEGGSQYVQQLTEALDLPIEELYVKSPEFVELVSAYMQQGFDKPDAEVMAKKDLAHKAAKLTGVLTAATSLPLNYFTSGLAKPFAGGKSLSKIIGEAVSEVPEEMIAEGSGQYFSNLATQKYLDRAQNLMEDVGSSAAEGAMGALGVTSTHLPSASLGATADAITSGSNYYQKKQAEALPETLKEKSSEPTETQQQEIVKQEESSTEATSIPKVEDIIVGRGKDTWKDQNVNEVKVGGKDKGSKYEEGTLTRPGTAPDKWNGQKLEDIKDPEGGKALGKFYSSNGSEYVYTDKGYTRRVKFNDPDTKGEDAGVNNWRKVLFLDKNDPMYKDFTEGFADKKQLAKDLLALNPVLTKDGKIAVFDKATQSWRSLQKSDLYPKRTADGTIKNENYQFKPVDQKPSTDKTLVEFELDDKGFIKNIHFSGGIGYVEGLSKNQDKAIKVAVPKSKESKAKPAKLNIPEITESFNSAPIPNTPFEYREDGSYIYRDPETNKAYPLFSTEEGKGFTSQDAFYKAALEKVKSFITTDNFILTQGSTTKDITVANNQFTLDNKIYDLSSEAQKVFNNPNATELEKAKALEDEFDGDNFTITPANTQSRDAYDLSPKELQKQGMHMEDGVVKEYDKQEVKDSWAKRFKEKFSKLVSFFIPVKRPIHLWNSDKSPVEVLLGILESKDSFEKFLRLNNFTNASRLANTLWGNKEKLVKQVVSMLSKDSTFMKKFQSQIDAGYFKKPDNCPEAVEEAFYDKDGNPNEKLLEISSIAALHWVALLSAYKHQLTDVEFTRLLQDPKLIASEFDTTGGVVTSAALQNLATSIRKFSGLAFDNNVDAKEAELVFGFIATKVASALIKANVVETFNVTYKVKEQDKNTGEWKLVDKELQFMKPTKDFDKLFRPNAGILLSIIDPTYTNSFHLEPPPVKETVAHSSEKITKTQKRVLEIANSKPAKINKLFVQFLVAIGGEEGLADLLEENAQESLRYLYSFKDYQSKQGRAISRRLAFDLIREVLISNPDMTIEEFEVYFSNVVLKNSRIMQEGAATYQSNKLVRQILNYSKNEKHNLTDADTFRAWRMILAQNLGVKVNARKFENYEKDIDSALSWLQEQVKTNPEYSNLLNKIKSVDARDILNENGKPNTLGVTFKKLMDEFNANFKNQKLSLKKEEGFNALLEMLRYAEATKEGDNKTEDLKAFESHIFLEIDGINDGPSYINRLFGVAMGSLSSQFFINNAKTGIFFGVALTSQEAMDDPEVIKFLGTGGKDFHAEVAQEKITGYFLQRAIAFNNNLKSLNSQGLKHSEALEAERALKVIKNTLKFFQAIGWIQINDDYKNRSIDDIVDNLKSLPTDSNKYPFTFDRDISKKLVTIIPYGSQPKGSTEQVLQLGLETFYEEMSNCFMAVSLGKSSKDISMNGVSFTEVMDSLKDLFGYEYTDSGVFNNFSGKLDDLVFSWDNHLPSKDELEDSNWRMPNSSGLLVNDADPFAITVRNFYIKSAGIEHLTRLLTPIFGEPAQAAVNEVLTTKGMLGAFYPTIISGFLTLLKISLQKIRSKTDKTFNDRYVTEKEINKVGPNYNLSGGAKVVVEKTSYANENEVLYTDPESGLEYRSSQSFVDSSGVSGSPLTTQASGDATTMMELEEILETLGILVGSVHDGFYTGLKDINTVGNAANKASNLAQKQRILKDISKQVERAGKFLQSRGYSNKSKPVEAVKECLIKIAQGKLIDGTNASEDLQEFSKKMQIEILRYLNQVEEATQFESDFFAQRELRRNRDKLGVQKDAKNIETNINNRLSSFFSKFDAILLTEEINQKVLNDIPRTIQHMSGADGQKATYSVGDVLSFKQALDLFKEANKVMKQLNLPIFETWGDLMSVFVNARAKRLYDKKVKAGEIDEKLQKSYEQLNGLDKGNSGTKNELPDEVYRVLSDTYFEPAESSSKNKSDFNSRDLDKIAIEKAFDVIKKNVKHPGIYEKFKQVILKLLPDDIPVKLVSSVAALPEDVRAKFNHTGQLGMYIVTNGKPHIYIVSKNGKLGLDNKQVAETLVHEAIHAVISATIAVYKQDPNKVPTAQRLALKNLENLLKDFLEQAPLIQSGVVQELKNKLESSISAAEKLDESIAYIMSNIEIFNALSNYRPKKISSFKNEFLHLLRSILGEVYNFIAKLFEITEGSALDKYFKELDKSIPEELNFISLYGANTLVVLGEDVRNPKGKEDRYSAVQELIRSAFVLPSADRTVRDITFSLESLRDTPMEFVTRASDLFIKASGWYKAMTNTGTLKQLGTFTERRRKISNADYIEESNKLAKYQEVLANALRNLVPEDKLEQIINTITMLQTQGFVPPMLTEALNEMFINTRKQLDLHFMVDKNTFTQEDIDISEGLYNLLFKSNLVNKVDRPETLNPQFQNAAIFYALAANIPAFSEAVGNLKINPPKLPAFKEMVNPFTLKEGFEKISIALMDNWKNLKFGQTSSGEIVHLIDNGRGEPGHPTLTKIAQAIDSVFHTADRTISTVLLAPWLFFKNKSAENLDESYKEVLESPVAMHGFLMNKFRDFANDHCTIFMSGMIKELYGRTPSNTGVEVFLKKIKGFFDKDRKINLEFLTNKLISEFKNTKVDSKFRQFLHRVIGRSEIIHLSLEEAQDVLTDKSKLTKLIKHLESDLRDNHPDSAKYMSKSLQLAKYLAGTAEAGHNLLTNGDAIGMLFGEPEAKMYRTEITHSAVTKINRLITLYYLRETLTDSDFNKLKEVYSNDASAMNNVIEQLNSAYNRDQKRSSKNFPDDGSKLYVYNRVHGFLPKGGSARGHYAIIPKSEARNYWKKGYDILGDYKDSVKGTPMVRVYTQWPHEREAQEGIFQTITETASGWEVQRRTRGEATGAKILEPGIVSKLQTEFKTKQFDTVIPIYTTKGSLLGFERAIPMEDRNKVNENTDLFSAIAQWNVRQTREQEAKNINAEAVEMMHQDWLNASDEQKRKQFVDIFNSKDPAIKAAVLRLPGNLKKAIVQKFGGEVCWVRKDVVWSYIGYHRMSITDVWDNTTIFPDALENTIAKILDLIFFNGRGRFYAGNIETVLMGAVTWVRDTIIVRSGIVPIVNALANVLVLHFSLGIPLTKLYQLYKENYNLTMKYNHLTKKKMDLIYQKNLITPVPADPNHPNNIKRNRIQQEIDDIESIYKNSPIYRLIKEGEYSTISAVGTTYEEIDIGKQKISDWLESRTNKFGEGSTARTAVSELLMNKSSTGYQLAADFVNLGDWLAKTVAYRYLTEGDNPRGLRLNHDEARNIASILFVDFDQFVSRERDWMNRIGLTWFMTYKYRMVPAALLGALLNPSRLILGTALSNWTGLGTPFNENLVAKFLSGELGYSVGYEMLFSGATMHPIPTILNAVK